MKNLSRWANRHASLAILIIVLCELLNGFNGVLLGMNLLEGWALGSLLLSGLVLVGGAIFVRIKFRSGQTYRESRQWLFGAFLGNFLLFGVLGGFWAERIQTPATNGAAWGSRRVVMRSDTIIKPENGLSGNQANYYASRNERPGDQTGKRIGYILLFVLGLALTYVTVGLACGIACSGYGLAALLVFFLGLGFTAGGIFFLSRSFDNDIVPLREMDKPKRRRTLRRFWIAWLALIGIAGALLAIGANS